MFTGNKTFCTAKVVLVFESGQMVINFLTRMLNLKLYTCRQKYFSIQRAELLNRGMHANKFTFNHPRLVFGSTAANWQRALLT